MLAVFMKSLCLCLKKCVHVKICILISSGIIQLYAASMNVQLFFTIGMLVNVHSLFYKKTRDSYTGITLKVSGVFVEY